MSKRGYKEWARHLRPDGKRAAAKQARHVARLVALETVEPEDCQNWRPSLDPENEGVAMTDSRFPILHSERHTSIPWRLIAPHAAQADRNHAQTLEQLAERGGLSSDEAVAVIQDRRWAPMHEQEADEVLASLVESYRE